jgi:hypothetical protein
MAKKAKKEKASVKANARRSHVPRNRSPQIRNEAVNPSPPPEQETPQELAGYLSPKLRTPQRGVPDLSGGDIDAAWDRGDEGEETVGGSHATPDQDVVEELGKAVGVTYSDNEPLRLGDKEQDRDSRRWELDPASAEDYPEHISQGKGTRKTPTEPP